MAKKNKKKATIVVGFGPGEDNVAAREELRQEVKKEVREELKAKKAQEGVAREPCGAFNAHSHGLDGELDNLECERDEGHAGNHRAKHLEYFPGNRLSREELKTFKSVVVEGRKVYEGKVLCEWTPASEFPVNGQADGSVTFLPSGLKDLGA